MFKKGSLYSRKDVARLVLGKEKPSGGNWDTGYVREGNLLLIFFNIGVVGNTGHNFDNQYEKENQTITWYGKPNTHSKQPLMKKIINGEIECHFFARWDNKIVDFHYLGIGKVISFEDSSSGYNAKGNKISTLKFIISCKDASSILLSENESEVETNFVLEKYLEQFIVDNWDNLDLGKKYIREEREEDGKRKKFRTDTGEIDIFAKSRDGKEFLVIELKKGRASDKVVGQIQNYMGYIKDEIAKNGEIVKGLIIALDDDKRIKRALSVANNIEFYRYKIKFDLVKN